MSIDLPSLSNAVEVPQRAFPLRRVKKLVAQAGYSALLIGVLTSGVEVANAGPVEKDITKTEKIILEDPKNVKAHLHLANLYITQGKKEQAVEEFKIALELEPKSEKALKSLFGLLTDLDRTEEAQTYLLLLDVEALIKSAQFYETIQDFEKATSFYRAVLLKDGSALVRGSKSGNHAVYGKLIELYDKLGWEEQKNDLESITLSLETVLKLVDNGDYEGALKILEEVEQGFPASVIYADIALALVHLKRIDKGLLNFEKAEKLGYKSPSFYFNWGAVLNQQGRHAEALEKYIKVEEFGGYNEPSFYFDFGALLVRSGDFASGVMKFKRAEELGFTGPDLYFEWGDALDQLGKINELISLYEKALKLYPNDVRLIVNLGSVLVDVGRLEESLLMFETAEAIKVSDPALGYTIYSNLGAILTYSKRFDEALLKFEEAEKLDCGEVEYCKNGEFYFYWGISLSALEKTEEALLKFNEAESRGMNSAPFYVQWGYALAMSGRAYEAKEKLNKALELDPNNKEAKWHLNAVEKNLVDLNK